MVVKFRSDTSYLYNFAVYTTIHVLIPNMMFISIAKLAKPNLEIHYKMRWK